MNTVFLTCYFSIFLIMEDMDKKIKDLNYISEYLFIQIMIDQIKNAICKSSGWWRTNYHGRAKVSLHA